MLAIRDNFVNIYYRGGNILNIKEHNKGFYQALFDNQYNKSGLLIPDSPTEIDNQNDSRSWLNPSQAERLLWTNTSQPMARQRESSNS